VAENLIKSPAKPIPCYYRQLTAPRNCCKVLLYMSLVVR
jgi:hypothetical protein